MANTITFNQTLDLGASSFDLLTGNAMAFAASPSLGPSSFRMVGNVLAPVLNAGFPAASVPMVDPNSGLVSDVWLRFFLALWTRTGGPTGSAM